MNILTFDVEEWFHLLDNDYSRSEQQWKGYEVRIYENMERIFQILEQTDTRATFFVVGWIAKTYPDIVRRIAEKYEIGSHTMTHQLVWEHDSKIFKADVEDSVKLLQDITGKEVHYFRAPGFSIRESEGWAFEALAKLGITTDCSVFPAHHAHGGMPSYGKVSPSIIRHNGIQIRELPISVKRILGQNFIFSGGGYFRLLPYWLIRNWSRQSPDYLMSYIHPRDLDAEQPMLEGLSATRKFKSYTGLKGAESKLRKYLTDFRFTDISDASAQIDWKSVPIVDL